MTERNIQYALERWAKEKDKVRDNHRKDHILIDMKMEIVTDDGGIPMGRWYTPDGYGLEAVTINHAFFAELPMEDHFVRGRFLDCLSSIVGYGLGFVDNTNIIIALIKSTIEQLLEAYWEVNHE